MYEVVDGLINKYKQWCMNEWVNYLLEFLHHQHRYLAVVHPISSMTLRSSRNALIAVGVMWVTIILLNAPTFLHYELHEMDEDLFCMNVRFFNPTYIKIFYGTFFLFGLVLPLFIIIILYSLMVLRLLKLGRNMKGRKTDKRQSKDGLVKRGEGKGKSENLRSKRRVMKMIIVVVMMFVLCWTPIHVMFMLQGFIVEDINGHFICFKIFCNCLAYANSCINPILYAFLSENFRNSFKKLLSLFCCHRCFNNCGKNINDGRVGRTFCEKSTVVASVIEMKPMKEVEKVGNEECGERREEVKNEVREEDAEKNIKQVDKGPEKDENG